MSIFFKNISFSAVALDWGIRFQLYSVVFFFSSAGRIARPCLGSGKCCSPLLITAAFSGESKKFEKDDVI